MANIYIDSNAYPPAIQNDWTSLEDILKLSITPFLQAEYMQDILKANLIWSRLTNTEGEAIAGKPNYVAAELAIATNTQTELDAYIPLIDEEGLPRA